MKAGYARERFTDRRAGFRRWLTAITLLGIAFEILAGHLHGLLLRGREHAPSEVQVFSALLILLPAVASLFALWPTWRRDPLGPLDEDVAVAGQLALATLLVGTGIHLSAAWAKGPRVPGPWGLLLPLIRHGPPSAAPLLAASLLFLVLRSLSVARSGLPEQEALPAFALALFATAAAASLDHGRIGFRPLPWTLFAPVLSFFTGVWVLRLEQLGRGPRAAGARQVLFFLLVALACVGLLGVGLHAGADLFRHPSMPYVGRFLLSPPIAAPALLTLLSLWGLYLVTGRDSLIWWAGDVAHPSSGRAA